MLVDRHDFGLNFDYVSGTTDPEDPEVKHERAQRARHGIKPPPLPILAPIAQRDPLVTAALVERYQAAQRPFRVPEQQPKSKLQQLLAARRGEV
ncbi:hypothetical protein ABZ412_34175 [Nocardia sp. NPDC005746]|uniref:hypothetical protein n=1 Tax=Nocardia sp. NPDC005746 TaxID=3157062 RepID=UPI0033C2C2E4